VLCRSGSRTLRTPSTNRCAYCCGASGFEGQRNE
jgi:hypothetical protein